MISSLQGKKARLGFDPGAHPSRNRPKRLCQLSSLVNDGILNIQITFYWNFLPRLRLGARAHFVYASTFPIWCTRSTDEAPWFPNLLLGIHQLIIFSRLKASKQIDTTLHIYICPLRLLFELAHTLCPFWIYRYGTLDALIKVLGGVIYRSAYTQSIWFLTWKQKNKSRPFYIHIHICPLR